MSERPRAGPKGVCTMYRDIQVSRVQDAQERPWMYGIVLAIARMRKAVHRMFLGRGQAVKALGFDPSIPRFDKFVWNKFERPRAGPEGGVHGGTE